MQESDLCETIPLDERCMRVPLESDAIGTQALTPYP